MQNKAIINARIVTEDNVIQGSIIYSDNGKIIDILKHEDPLFDTYQVNDIIDAQNAYAVPGGIDAHVHLGGFGSIPIADDFYTGTCAAIAGGTTTVIDFCEPVFGEKAIDCIKKRKKEALDAVTDYAFHFVLTEEYKRLLRELDVIKEEGIRHFKLFTIYDNSTLTMSDIVQIFDVLQPNLQDYTFLVHAEDAKQIAFSQKQYQENIVDMYALSKTRPISSETSIVLKLQELLRAYKANVCIAHTSTGEAVTESYAQDEPRLQFETCPHYLEFSDKKLKSVDGALYTMTPPLRKSGESDMLWEKILDNKIEILSTDHCPYHKCYKENQTYMTVPCGVDGIQTRMLYLFSEGVVKRGMHMQEFVKLSSSKAARFYKMYPQKGCLQSGSDADIVLITDQEETLVTIDNMAGNIDYTIYEGKKFNGKIKMVIKGGKLVYDGNQVLAQKGSGHFIFQ